jgi:predicted transcriptional regulator
MQTETMTSDTEMKMITDIVSHYAGNPSATPESIAELMTRLKAKMAMPASEIPSAPAAEIPSKDADEAPKASAASAETPAKAKPAVPVSKSVTNDKVVCLCCGQSMKMLKRHLGAAHNLSPAEYRAKFDLPEDHPLTAPSYTKQKRSMAEMVGFGKYERKKENAKG